MLICTHADATALRCATRYPLYRVGQTCLRCAGQLVFAVEPGHLRATWTEAGPQPGPQPGGSAGLHVAYPSLLPGTSSAWSAAGEEQRFSGLAVQPRNVQFIKAMGTKLIRLGGSFASSPAWLWTQWTGPAHTRPSCACTGQSTDFAGWGPFEFIDFALAAGAQPVVTTALGTPAQMADLVE